MQIAAYLEEQLPPPPNFKQEIQEICVSSLHLQMQMELYVLLPTSSDVNDATFHEEGSST